MISRGVQLFGLWSHRFCLVVVGLQVGLMVGTTTHHEWTPAVAFVFAVALFGSVVSAIGTERYARTHRGRP